MSYGVFFTADLELPATDAWHDLLVDVGALAWEADAPFELGAPPRTVREALAALREGTAGHERFVVDVGARSATIRAWLHEETFRAHGAELAALVRAAAAVGGRGRGAFVQDEGGDFGYRIEVGPDGSRCVEVDAAEARKLVPAAVVRAIVDGVEPARPEAAAAYEPDGALASIMARVTAMAPDRLLAIARRSALVVTDRKENERPLADVVASGEAIASALRTGSDPAIDPQGTPAAVLCAWSIVFFAADDPVAAAPVVRAILQDEGAPDAHRQAAAHALAYAADDASAAALFGVLEGDAPTLEAKRLRWAAARALMRVERADVGDRVLALFDASTDSELADVLLAILAERRHAPAVPHLAPFLVRGSAKVAPVLLAIGTEEALALLGAHLESPDFYLADAAVGAVFARDASRAWERLAPYLAPSRLAGKTCAPPAESIVRALADGHVGVPQGTKAVARPWLEADPRWFDTLLDLVRTLEKPVSSTLPFDALALVARLGDARATPVVAGLFGSVDAEPLAQALLKIGDPSALGPLEAALAKTKKEKTKKALARVIERLEKVKAKKAARPKRR